MLKRLLNKLKGLFGKKSPVTKDSERSKPTVGIGQMVGNVKITKQYQLDKHTAFKPGEQYRLGKGIVTVHANKASMLRAIAAVDKKREEKHAKMRERAIDLMLMSPEEFMATKVNEWLQGRKITEGRIERIVGKFTGQRYIKPNKEQFTPPSGILQDRFNELVEKSNTAELVTVGGSAEKENK